MRPGVTPHQISDFKSFPVSTLQCLEDQPSGSFSGFSKDGKVCWIVRGALLEVLEISSCKRLAAWQFGRILSDEHTNITCVEEFDVGQTRKLLVGVCNASTSGFLCLFDVNFCKVIKCIEVAHPVTEVGVISLATGNNVPNWALSEHLRYFCGLVSVGTQTGKVFLVDMCIDDNEFYSDEEVPSKLHIICPKKRDIENQRFQCMSQGFHLAMVLNESMYSGQQFDYQKPGSVIMKTFSLDEVSVTCLKYIQQAGILVIGYNFGCYQLWKLSTPVLEYSSRIESEPMPITHIAYQEPENDPKNFCYIWIARGEKENTEQSLDSVSNVSMYQLAFNNKTHYSNYGVFYEELMSVCLRLDHELTTSLVQYGTNYDGASRILGCYTLEDPNYKPPSRLHSEDNESFEEGGHGPDLSLCVFVWEATEGSISSRTRHYLAVFDVNRWYHAQMPASVRYVSGSTDVCAYLGLFVLDEAVENAGNDNMLMAYVKTDRLWKFINHAPVPPEQHFYPASLAFDVTIVCESGLVNAQFLGSQRHLLATMESKGPSVLLQPMDMYNLCVHVGLLPRATSPITNNTNLSAKRELLLGLALEYNMVSFLKSCIIDWSSGEYEHHGCTLKFLLDWAWDTVSSTKHKIDTTCTPLYNMSRLPLDKRSIQTLVVCNERLTHLSTMFRTFLTLSGPITEEGGRELQSKILVTSILSQHLSVVLWFVEAGLLPEDDDLEETPGSQYCYPATSLMTAYKNRRQQLNNIHSDVKDTDLLMIDGLVEAIGVREVWERDGGLGLYPPPSLYSLLSTYMLENCDMLYKHCLVLYLLLDLLSVDSAEENDEAFSEKVGGFTRRFNLPPNLVKLIQAFWLLDHRDFDESLNLLLDPMVRSNFARWQHSRIIKALLYQGDAKMALKYIKHVNPALTTPEEVKLKLTILLANGLTAEALEYQRVCCDKNNVSDLLSHLFLGCQQTKTVGRLLQLPLTEEEDKFFVDYLMASTEPNSQELLVMHYLQRARYVEAIQLNEKLKHSVMTESSSAVRERAAARNAIVEGYASVLPAVQRRLMFEQVHVPKKNTQKRREVRRPTPLSTQITKSNARVLSQSVFIMTIMEKLDEIDTPELNQTNVQDRSIGPFICTPVTPGRKSQRDTPATVYPEHEGDVSMNDGLSFNKSVGMFNSTDTPSKSDKRKSKFFSASCLTMLKTPTIKRMTPRKQSTSSANVITPQSILKVRHMISTTSPSPHSGSTTPNSQELEGSGRKLPRKLGYGGTTPLSGIPRRLLSDTSMSTSMHSPKSVSFVEPASPQSPPVKHSPTIKLSTPAAVTPKSAITTPKSVGTTPKSVSFVEKTFTSVSQLQPLSTPKQLRFSEPESSKETSKARLSKSLKTPTPPSSPRSVKDRSPTPESMEKSPKFVRNLDQLQRPPLHPHSPPKEEDIVLRLDNSDISDEEVEQMEQSYGSPMSQASADMSISSTATVREQVKPVSPLGSPEKPSSSPPQPSSPKVRVSKSATSQFTSQTINQSTEHTQSEQTGSPKSADVQTGAQSKDLETSDMEVNQSKEIFQDFEELNPPGEIEEMETVSSSEEKVTQSIKQEVEDDFTAPPEPARQLNPPIPLTEQSQMTPPQRRSVSPGSCETRSTVKVKDSPPDNKDLDDLQNSEYMQNILKDIDDKFGTSPDVDQKSVTKTEVDPDLAARAMGKRVPSRRTIQLANIKPETESNIIESEDKVDSTTVLSSGDEIAPTETEDVPATPTRSTRRKTRKSEESELIQDDEPVTPSRSTRARRKKDGATEAVTPTRSTRRTQQKEESVEQETAPLTPTRSTRKKASTSTAQEDALVEIKADSPKPFSTKAKEAVQESLIQVSKEVKEKMEMESPDRGMTKIKDRSPKTPTRSKKGQKEAVTPTRMSSRLTSKSEDTDNDENIPVTPTRSSRRGKKDVSPTVAQQKPTTPRRGRKKIVEAETSVIMDENTNDNKSNSPVQETEDIMKVAQIKRTPTRGRKKKDDSIIETIPIIEAQTPPRRSRRSSELSDSKRDSFGHSEIPVDIVQDESLVATPTRRQSLSRACKTVTENRATTPTRRRSIGHSNQVKEAQTPPRRQSLSRSFKVRDETVIKPMATSELETIEQSPVKEEETAAPLTPSRRGRSKKTETTKETTEAPLTPSRRGRKKIKPQIEEADSSTKDEQNIDSNDEVSDSKKAKIDDVATPAARTRSHDRKTQEQTDVYDIQTNSFQFSDPMQIDTSEPSVKAFTPVKSFIFSPPINHTRSRVQSEKEDDQGILLPPGPAVTQVTEDPKPTEKKKPKRKLKRLYKEQEEIIMISPLAVAEGDSGSEGLGIVTRSERGRGKRATTKKEGSKLVVQSVARGRKLRTSSRFGPLGSKKT